ncbi:hypothetical protein [Streptomyces sp. NPDC058451]|uniref:hypothetical protein n=1 Tax=unclassified Streptomyces TaxID=2593676 RepID=UPI0036507606
MHTAEENARQATQDAEARVAAVEKSAAQLRDCCAPSCSAPRTTPNEPAPG